MPRQTTDLEFTIEFLREHFHYNPATGEITRKKGPKMGKLATVNHSLGYLKVIVCEHAKPPRYLSASRLAWLLHYGVHAPANLDVAHANHCKSDNSIKNLQLLTHKQAMDKRVITPSSARKLSITQVEELRRRPEQSYLLKAEYGVSIMALHRARVGLTYKECKVKPQTYNRDTNSWVNG